jgi:DNA recombination protein RmuC
MENYGLAALVAGLAALFAGILFYLKGRSAGTGQTAEAERLMQNLNSQIQEQTALLVGAIVKIREENKSAIGQSFTETQKNLAESMSLGRREMSESLARSQKFLSERLEALIKETAEMRSASNNMLEVGKDIKQLSNILENPKSRGGFGEFQLEVMLGNVIPADRYRIQYKIGSGMADAALLLKDSVLCIDSKFPMANLKRHYESENGLEQPGKFLNEFYRDVRSRAKEIRERYILPPTTLDFAIMFVPSESVFMEIVMNRELHEKLLEMRVIPASPNFLYVYFQALAIGFRGMAVEERAAEIIRAISELKVRFENFHDVFGIVGTHLENAMKKYSESEKQLLKVETSLENMHMGGKLTTEDVNKTAENTE